MDRIDLHKILRERVPRKYARWIPGFLISGLERLIHQRELNGVMDYAGETTGSAFCDKVMEYFEIHTDLEGMEHIPDAPLIFVSNHPLGGLDGIALISTLGHRYGDEHIQFLVNDMLMNLEPLRPVFLPINKYGSQGREAATRIERAFESPETQMMIFPAGLVSRLHPDGRIADLKWQKSFVQKAIEHRRDIVPIRFEALNRRRFYRLAKWRKKSGIKVNLEQALLPAELCASRGKHLKIRFLPPVSWRELKRRVDAGESPTRIAADLRLLSNP